MNLEEIKKKVDNAGYWGDISPNEIEKDIEYLLSIIEQAEKSLEKISKNAYLDHLGDVSLLMLQMSGNIADEALKAIRGN